MVRLTNIGSKSDTWSSLKLPFSSPEYSLASLTGETDMAMRVPVKEGEISARQCYPF